MNQERFVEGITLVSSVLPAMHVEITDPRLQYVGTTKYILKNIADVESFYFVEAKNQFIHRLFFVQFEKFLPHYQGTYRYTSDQTVRLGEHDYLFDAIYGSYLQMALQNPESDVAHDLAVLTAQGYQAGDMDDVMRDRYMRIVDDDRRAEVIFIYAEALKPFDVTCESLEKDAERWRTLSAEMHNRALNSFKVVEG